jgi:tetratricopeptide (TPR) repeat protein
MNSEAPVGVLWYVEAVTSSSETQDDRQYQLALTLLRAGREREAISACRNLVKAFPRHADGWHLLGVMALQAGDHAGAAEMIGKAIEIAPATADYYANRGVALQELGQSAAAVEHFDRAIALRANVAEVHYNRATALMQLGQLAAAIEGFGRALALDPTLAEAHYNRARAFHEQRELQAAHDGYASALAVNADHVAARYGLGLAQLGLGAAEAALVNFDRVIAAAPEFADAHYARGNTLLDLNGPDEAFASYSRAVALDPGHIDAAKNVFRHHLGAGSDLAVIERLSDDVSATKARQEEAVLRKTKRVARFRLQHDLEQTGYLLARGYDLAGLAEANRYLRQAYERRPLADTEVALTNDECEVISRFRGQRWRYPLDALEGPALSPGNDWHAIEDEYFAGNPQIIAIDDFLSAAALAQMQTFCLSSTIWRTEYVNQYLGAFAEDGFFTPLHFQIAAELRVALPRIFQDQRLEQLWGFKYNSHVTTGINVHADFAKVNLNFWITPDEANLAPGSGGMIVHDVPAPPSWNFDAYNKDETAIHAFLKANRAGSKHIPYKCNRAVLFNSALFHETDEVHFKDGYENRRINVTYLFGRGLKTVSGAATAGVRGGIGPGANS